jgi:hypothetical protein
MSRNLGEQVSDEEHEDMRQRLSIFKSWFMERYMKDGEQDSILVFPISNVKPNYRDTYPGPQKSPSTGLRPSYLSPYIGSPELAIPSKFPDISSYFH